MKLFSMKTASKLIMHSMLAALAFVATHTVSAAPQNGNGIVFNKSDCTGTQFRFYTDLGNGPGSPCDGNPWGDQIIFYISHPPGQADLSITYGKCIHAGGGANHNWTLDELKRIGNPAWVTAYAAFSAVDNGQAPSNYYLSN